MPKSRNAKGNMTSGTSLARRIVEQRELVEGLERDKARLEGAYQEILRRLKEEHGYDSLAEGKKKLAKLDKEAAALEKQFQAALEEFEAKWGDKLEERS